MEKFNSSFRGYNIKEVNNFVDEMTREYTSMLDKLKKKDEEIQSLNLELKKYKEMESSIGRASIYSSETNSQITQMARNEAKMIIDDAKRNASRIVNDALLDAERTEMRAEQLRRNMVVFKRRLRAIVQTGMQTVEDIDELKLDD